MKDTTNMTTKRNNPTETNPSKSPAVRATLLVTLCLLPLLLAACDNFERDAYRTLKLAGVEYELLQDHAARAAVRGQMTAEQWERFAIAGRRFIAAHTLAVDLLSTYSNAKKAGADSDRDRLRERIQTSLAHLPALLADLHVLLDSLKSQPSQTAVPAASAQPEE